VNTYRQTTPKSCGPDAVARCLAPRTGFRLLATAAENNKEEV